MEEEQDETPNRFWCKLCKHYHNFSSLIGGIHSELYFNRINKVNEKTQEV